ncbi:hypothetical protein COT65_01135 [Candidatus Shapirobacteria bacterium CG09_land_8_20_14_0_10_47_13]|uniref:ASCH domain-containing protein n=1 Tax=Candidatus Shapirobacteria bacterium CG09_land_8_20_14_0_10_47_13 TaxID=1974481 RepID=A0A2H0WN00_9BACT|nr:MAG: hypothetical protein COT65_01135 [Candidatus Shapirobacteria bacterium CG09_land_8_20_14_0_10_47_13]
MLLIRETDRWVFEAIKAGQKTIETRAATPKYQKIKIGDVLVFVCGQDRLEKQVAGVSLFAGLDQLLAKIDLKEIMPSVSSPQDAKKIWYSFPNYREKIKQYGLVAWRLK